MRGKPSSRSYRSRPLRIIPAHAGQTGPAPGRLDTESDHPRACGANLHTVTPRSNMPGSSPRMRGKPGRNRQGIRCQRIIPAHAGQTWTSVIDCSTRTDHPRACGANSEPLGVDDCLCGSSPRMRGKLWAEQTRKRSDRIIPAHAGQTIDLLRAARHQPDHPRACGANPIVLTAGVCANGSSPRMRGKPCGHV